MNEYPDHSTLSRRRLLGLGATGAVAATLPASVIAQRPPAPDWPKPKQPVRNIIFMVSDGMSMGAFTLAEMMRKHKGMGPSHWRMLWDKPGVRRATCMTHSADGWVTDSAAAGSAWGSGEHINNGAINFTPDERTPEPIHITAQKLGKATGLVATSRITHATPASFVANVPKRSLEDAIAEQILDRNVDVALGGGAKHFQAELLAKHPDVTLARSLADLNAAANKTGRLLGLFHDDHCHYELDRPADLPSLRQMAEVALKKLENSNTGFVSADRGRPNRPRCARQRRRGHDLRSDRVR